MEFFSSALNYLPADRPCFDCELQTVNHVHIYSHLVVVVVVVDYRIYITHAFTEIAKSHFEFDIYLHLHQ
jgi:hypothetical protein